MAPSALFNGYRRSSPCRNIPSIIESPGTCDPRLTQAGPREFRRFSYARELHRRDRTVWLGM
jgi:hypothetical protein